MLSDGRFWAGVVVGLVALFAYQKYTANKSA